jgi:hypothetical protein
VNDKFIFYGKWMKVWCLLEEGAIGNYRDFIGSLQEMNKEFLFTDPALWPIWRVLIGGPVVQANTVRFP